MNNSQLIIPKSIIMKKVLFLFFAMAAISAFGQNSIPNGNFEDWNTITYESPQNYPFSSIDENIMDFISNQMLYNLVNSTDAYHGSSAVQLSTVLVGSDTAFGYMINTQPTDEDPMLWTGGIPISEKPTGLRGYYQYNTASGDSAIIIITFSKTGNNVGSYMFKLGGLHSSYTLFDFNFIPALTVTPDSMVLALISSDVMNPGFLAIGSSLTVDSISLKGISAQPALMNGDFELWQTNTIYSLADWYAGNSRGQGLAQTTDKIAGDYALELETILNDHGSVPRAEYAEVSTGYWDDNCGCLMGGFPFGNQTDTLEFYYKYAPSDLNDSAIIFLDFKSGGTIFSHFSISLGASASYQFYDVPISLFQTPDSIIITIRSTRWEDSLASSVGAILKIDEMQFRSQPLTTGISPVNFSGTFNVFPNPSADIINIEIPEAENVVYFISIRNMQGQEVLSDVFETNSDNNNLKHPIDIRGLVSGVYMITLKSKNAEISKKLIIQK